MAQPALAGRPVLRRAHSLFTVENACAAIFGNFLNNLIFQPSPNIFSGHRDLPVQLGIIVAARDIGCDEGYKGA